MGRVFKLDRKGDINAAFRFCVSPGCQKSIGCLHGSVTSKKSGYRRRRSKVFGKNNGKTYMELLLRWNINPLKSEGRLKIGRMVAWAGYIRVQHSHLECNGASAMRERFEEDLV